MIRHEAEEIQHSKEVIEVTPEMIEAGAAELRERMFGEPLNEVAHRVFVAMLSAR